MTMTTTHDWSAAAAGQAHPDHEPLASFGVGAEQVVEVPHPAAAAVPGRGLAEDPFTRESGAATRLTVACSSSRSFCLRFRPPA